MKRHRQYGRNAFLAQNNLEDGGESTVSRRVSQDLGRQLAN